MMRIPKKIRQESRVFPFKQVSSLLQCTSMAEANTWIRRSVASMMIVIRRGQKKRDLVEYRPNLNRCDLPSFEKRLDNYLCIFYHNAIILSILLKINWSFDIFNSHFEPLLLISMGPGLFIPLINGKTSDGNQESQKKITWDLYIKQY